MSQELLKKLVSDSENYSSRYKKGLSNQGSNKLGQIHKKSKKIHKEAKAKTLKGTKNANKAGKGVLGDKFKNLVRKMKVSTDRNLILEKNLIHLAKLRKKTKVTGSVSSYLLEKLNQK